MRALSIRAPWWWYILHGGKDIENRDWRYTPRSRGRRLIHASTWWKPSELDAEYQAARRMGGCAIPFEEQQGIYAARGCIVGSVEIVDYVYSSASPWFCGPLGIVLRNPIAFASRVPVRGRLGFFYVEDRLIPELAA